MRGNFRSQSKHRFGYAPDPEPVPAPWWNEGGAMNEWEVSPSTSARDEYGYADLIDRRPWQDPHTAPPGYQNPPDLEYLKRILGL